MMRIVIIFSILAISAFSCVSPTKPTSFMSQELKDYTDFKTGSYWIYMDSANPNVQDSIALIFHKTSIAPEMDGADGPPPAEVFNDTLISSKEGKFTADGTGSIDDYHMKYSTWTSAETVYYIPASGTQYDDWGSMTYLGSLPNVNFSGYKYNLIKQFQAEPNSQFPLMPPLTHIFWAKNIGIVKKTVSGKTWILIRYHVVQ